MSRISLGRVGIWSGELRDLDDRGAAAAATAELEALGYGALFIPGRAGGDVLTAAESLLAGSASIVVATGILNVWRHTPAEVATRRAQIDARHPGRFLLGLGVSHAPLVDPDGTGLYRRPLAMLRGYLDDLDAATPPAPAATRILAALGPKMLQLARDRSVGAHPYLAPPENTAAARAILGPGPLLAPEQPVLLETDPAVARRQARRYLGRYLDTFPNYVNNLRRFGFGDDDLTGGGSDRLVDAVVAWGDEAAIGRRVAEHHGAGADHVCLQVLPTGDGVPPLDAWRRLAPALVEV
jgi:probable F420-dependent oxidoreductase